VQLLTLHDLNFLHEKKHIHKLKHKMKMRWRVSHSGHVVVISQYVADDLRKFMGNRQLPLSVIHNAINDVENEPQQRPSFIHSDDEKFFFTIGQIRQKKNFHTLVPMMKHLPDHNLYICGDDHFSYAATVRQAISDCHEQLLRPDGTCRAQLCGIVSEAEKNWMFAHCQAFLFPSTLEGFGLPVLEAMRMGAPVVSSRYSSLPEVCGGHAFFFDSYEPKSMARCVTDALEQWHDNVELQQAAKTYARSFSYENYTHAYLSLYRRLLGLQ